MSDIRYKWNDGLNSVQVSGDVSLPQFKVRTHFLRTEWITVSGILFWFVVLKKGIANNLDHFEYNKFWFLAILISVKTSP